MMPASQAATSSPPNCGRERDHQPATISITPTISIAVWAGPGTRSLIQGAR